MGLREDLKSLEKLETKVMKSLGIYDLDKDYSDFTWEWNGTLSNMTERHWFITKSNMLLLSKKGQQFPTFSGSEPPDDYDRHMDGDVMVSCVRKGKGAGRGFTIIVDNFGNGIVLDNSKKEKRRKIISYDI